jgi:hypothetical protein
VADLTPQQLIWRDRVEALIGLAAPALDLLLTVGDRVSRIVDRDDSDPYPVRSGSGASLPADFERPRSGSPPSDGTA